VLHHFVRHPLEEAKGPAPLDVGQRLVRFDDELEPEARGRRVTVDERVRESDGG
jgi:hypothetical protein